MDLLQRLKSKETDALKKAVEIYTPYVATVIFNAAASLSKEDAEETAADVFAALWKNADLLDSEKGSIKSYLAGAARKAAAQKLRKQIPDSAPLEENYIGEVDLQEDTDSMHEPDIYVSCLIDGKFVENSANNNKRDFYAEDEHTLKFAEKYNISGMDIKDKFSVELIADTDNSYEIFNKLCSGKEISENDKKNSLYVSVITDKTQAEKNGYSKEFDIPLWQKGTRLKRFILSPFASQLVIESDKNAKLSDTVFFAAFDENGKSLDVLNTGLMHSDKKKSYNSYELLKVTDDTKEISLVPINFDEAVNTEIIRKKADEYPLKYKLGQDGYVVVTAVRFKDGEIDVDYRKDGFTTFDPEFYFYGADGKEIEMPGIKSVDVHYDTNSYTAKYVSNSKNANLPERLKSEALKNTLKELGCVKNEVKLEYEKAVKIKLR